jgi:hypothetical protein
MKNEISTMIELQHFWDNVMKCDNEIKRCRKSIKTWELRLKEISLKSAAVESDVKTLKMKLKKNELDLDETDIKIKKVEERKNQLKSEREVEAQNNELIVLNDNKNKLEGVVLDLLDKLEISEKTLEELKNQLTESEKQTKADIEGLNKKITDNQSESDNFKNRYNEILTSLDPQIRSRFSKLISSKDGIAIAALNGETCSRCNFQIPSSITLSASSGKSIETCTNCGRFIY